MAERPKYCATAMCQNFRAHCVLKELDVDMFLSKKGKKREEERLDELAENDPAELIRRCSMTDTRVVFRR